MDKNKTLQPEYTIRIKVKNQSYAFKTSLPEEDVREIVELVNNEFEAEGDNTRGHKASIRDGVLASLRLADKYVRLKKRYNSCREEQQARDNRLIAKLQTCLDEKLSDG